VGEGTEMRRNPNKVRRFELGGPGTKGEGKRSIISATLGRNWKRQVGQAEVVDPSRPLGGTVVYHRFEAAYRNYVQYRMREPRKEKWEFAGGVSKYYPMECDASNLAGFMVGSWQPAKTPS
jgi:hypothetical protein